MFKENSTTWLYLVGVIIMFAVLLFIGREFYYPAIEGEKKLDVGDVELGIEPTFTIDLEQDYLVELDTSHGRVIIDLYETNAPNNVNNFINLVQDNYYDDTKFHRLVPNLLVHGGDRRTLDDDPANDGQGNPGYLINDEINWDSLGLSEERRQELEEKGFSSDPDVNSQPLERFSIAMANAGPDTNGSQFFIIISSFDDPRLEEMNGQYTVIGKVINGFDTLTQIANIPVQEEDGNKYRPTEEIVINNAEIFTR